jgi:hypothetical protein
MICQVAELRTLENFLLRDLKTENKMERKEKNQRKKEIKKRINYVEMEVISYCDSYLSINDVITLYAGPRLYRYCRHTLAP